MNGNEPVSVFHESKEGDENRNGYRSYKERQTVGVFNCLKFRFRALNDNGTLLYMGGTLSLVRRFPGFARSSFVWEHYNN